jgi:hypothetical protein
VCVKLTDIYAHTSHRFCFAVSCKYVNGMTGSVSMLALVTICTLSSRTKYNCSLVVLIWAMRTLL